MSTVTRSKPSSLPADLRVPPPLVRERRIVIRGVDWEIYDRLFDAVGEGQHVRLAYDGKDLEIMTTGYPHQYFKDLLGLFVSEVATELAILATAAARPPGSVPSSREAWRPISAITSYPRSGRPPWRR